MTKEELELLSDFIVEMNEELEYLEANFVELDHDRENHDIINKIFRSIHSIKGSSGFFGLESLTTIAHRMETLLDHLRKKTLDVTEERVSALLEGLDFLKGCAARISASTYVKEMSPEEEAFLEKLEGVTSAREMNKDLSIEAVMFLVQNIAIKVKNDEYDIDDDVDTVMDILETLKEVKLEELIQQQEKEATPTEQMLYRFGDVECSEEMQAVLKVREFLESDAEIIEDKVKPLLGTLETLAGKLEAGGRAEAAQVKEFNEFISSMIDSPIGLEKDIRTMGLDILLPVFDTVSATAAASAETAEKTEESMPQEEAPRKELPEKPKEEETEEKMDLKKTMRVEEDKIDHFINFVGDLIVASEVFNYIQKKLENTHRAPDIAKEFKNANITFNELSNNLQKSLMDIRKVPVSQVVKRVPRMVRDLCNALHKKVKVVVEGGDTSIDKSLLEVLEAPIVHMVRNSMDHGIEHPEERLAAGKPEEGTIKIKAYETSDFFTLEIIDDGRGIDPEKMREVAVKKELMSEEKAKELNDHEAINLIFAPGFSTAEEVTDVSGRGVGMDVVLSSISKNNGMVSVVSEKGKGSTVTIQLPLSVTLIVVEGLLITVGKESFIIPLIYIRESIQPKKEDVYTVSGKGEMIQVRDECIPLLRLHELFNLPGAAKNPWEALIIVICYEDTQICLLVDELLGQQQVVLKELGRSFAHLNSIKGGAILGDGKVGLVLDIEGIAERFNKSGESE